MNYKTKITIKAAVAILLDLIAIGIVGYTSLLTMNLLLWILLLMLGLVFAYDATRAITFLTEFLSKKE
jgi:hypothetical protein